MRLITLLILILCSHLSLAADLYSFDSLQKKQQFESLTQQLRCLVCQNQSLADSNAPLAVDLRNQVYSMVQQNRSNDEILNYMTSRYSEYVLLKPSLEKRTLLLWLAPLILLMMGAFIIRNTTK